MENAVLWGAGEIGGSSLIREIISQKYNIISYCDKNSNIWGQNIDGIIIKSPFDLLSDCENNLVDIIIITISNSEVANEIKKNFQSKTKVMIVGYTEIAPELENMYI